MTAEQLIEKLQELIGRGTISPLADIKIEVDEWNENECPNCGQVEDCEFRGDFNNAEIEMYDTTYTRLCIKVS